MHELSIAIEILSIAEQEAMRHGADHVKTVILDLGGLSGVEPSSLEFCFGAVRGENALTHRAELVIRRIPPRYGCGPCKAAFTGDVSGTACPRCGNTIPTLLAGKELNVVELEIE